MDKLNDVTMLSLMQKKPWNIFKYSREMARIHVKIHSTEVPGVLPSMMDEYEKSHRYENQHFGGNQGGGA